MRALLIKDMTKSVFPKGVIMCLSPLHYPSTHLQRGSFLVRLSTQRGMTVLRLKKVIYVKRVIVRQDVLTVSFTSEVDIAEVH